MNPVLETVLKQTIHTALLEVFGKRLVRDSDGDWPTPVGTRPVFIRMEQDPAPHAFVFTRAATSTSRDCLSELHDLNVSAAWSKFVRSPAGDIFVIQRVLKQDVSADSLRLAIFGVATCADDCGTMLQTVYGSSSTSEPDAQ
jgi:hypothetical protein